MGAILIIVLTGLFGFLLGTSTTWFISVYRKSDMRYTSRGKLKLAVKIGMTIGIYMVWIVIACATL